MRKSTLLLLFFSTLFCYNCGGGSSDGTGTSYTPPPVITGVDPVQGVGGDTITIVGQFLDVNNLGETVSFGRFPATVVAASNASVTVTVPPQADREIDLTTVNGTSKIPFTLAATTQVAEVEPNDDAAGANATAVGPNRQVTGRFSSITDADYFSFSNCTNKAYKVEVQPVGVVSSVMVNGVSMPVTNGSTATFAATSSTTLVGISGGTGSYYMVLQVAGPVIGL